MEFRDLKKQYRALKDDIDREILSVTETADFISGSKVRELENELAEYVGVKHCITCANGTDALELAVMAWGIGPNDAVFVPDFTFFSSGEIVAHVGATPVFVDICEDTFNLSPKSLEDAIKNVLAEGKLTPKAVVAVDLFGQPANYEEIIPVCKKYGLKLLEDSAQGFGGKTGNKMNCSFGDISITSFFPAKPLGCYGDGGAVFTDNDEWAAVLRSLRVHGKGDDKYDNIRIGMNSRLDTMQAAVLKVKLKAFIDYELRDVNIAAKRYDELLKDVVKTPTVLSGMMSSWAQYSILLDTEDDRDNLQVFLRENGIPAMIYYRKPMHSQKAFDGFSVVKTDLSVTNSVCKRVISLPIHPYITEEEQVFVADKIKEFLS